MRAFVVCSFDCASYFGLSWSDYDAGVARNFGVRAVFVSVRVAVEQREYEQDEPSDERNEGDEIPPAALADVVQTPHGNRQSRNEKLTRPKTPNIRPNT